MLAALFVVPALAAAACEKKGQTMTPQSDKDLDAKLADLRTTGGSAPLRMLTSFDWDAVYCFYEGATADEVNGAVGDTVLEPGSRLMVSGALAVFAKGGTVVRPIVIPELTFTPGRQPDGVVVEKGLSLVKPG